MKTRTRDGYLQRVDRAVVLLQETVAEAWPFAMRKTRPLPFGPWLIAAE